MAMRASSGTLVGVQYALNAQSNDQDIRHLVIVLHEHKCVKVPYHATKLDGIQNQHLILGTFAYSKSCK